MDWIDVARLAVGFIDDDDTAAARAALQGAINRHSADLREHKESKLVPIDHTHTAPPNAPSAAGKLGGKSRAERAEQRRQRALEIWSPSALLYLPNAVRVFLRDHPMWSAWDWEATAECNARLAHLVPRLYPHDPLPNDVRLALPLTAAGLFLWRALVLVTGPLANLEPSKLPDVRASICQEIRDGVVLLDKIHAAAGGLEDASAEFRGDLTAAIVAAEGALMHFLLIGQESWRLIRACRMETDCLLGTPYFVNPTGGDPHGGCRVKRHRAEPEM